MTSLELPILAARYATAALNVWGNPLSIASCAQLDKLIIFYKSHQLLIFFLQMPLFTYEQKKEALIRIRLHYALPDCLDQIGLLLLTQHRIFMLLLVYEELIKQSYTRLGVVPCDVTTAIKLSEKHQKMCAAFIKKICTKKILITWRVDPSLIAGIRVQTEEGLWENSIDAQLRIIANTVLI